MKKLYFIAFILLISASANAQNLNKEKLFDLYQNQRYADAAVYLRNVYGEDSKDSKVLSQIGYCYTMSKNTEEAEKFYYKVYQLDNKNLATLFNLASLNRRRGNSEKTKQYLSEIIKIDSNNFNVYEQLASMYRLSDSIRTSYLIKANTIDPINPDVAMDLAEALAFEKKYDKAYQTLDIAIKADTGYIIMQKAQLPIANKLKKYNEVIRIGERMLKSDNDFNVVKEVAKAYFSIKNYQKCIDYFKRLEKETTQNELSLYYTSLSYRYLKNYPMAITYTKKTIEEGISKNTSDYYALLGLVYKENEKVHQAIKTLKKGLEYANNPTIFYRMATIYDINLKDQKTAKTYYALYLKSKPDAEANKDEIVYALYRLDEINKANK